jgi:AcrR family transcriptional regulator
MRRPSQRHRAQRGHGQALREEILAAAAALLADTGNEEAVSIRAVAERVGVTPPSIYLHFADKEALLEAVCVESFVAFDGRIAAASKGSAGPLEALQAIGRAYVEFALERPEHYRYMFMRRPALGVFEPTAAELETLGGLVRVIELVRAAQGRGLIAPGRDAAQVAYALWCATHGIAALLVAKPYFPWGDREALIESVIEMAVRGVAGEADDRAVPRT